MGVKIRERKLADGEVTFYIDTYHRDYGRFSQKTDLKVNPKNRKEYNKIKADAFDRARKVEKDLEHDPAAVFQRKAVASNDFVDFVRERAGSKRYSAHMNSLKYLRGYTGGRVPFKTLNSQWLERFKSYLLSAHGLSDNTANTYLVFVMHCIRLAYKAGYIPDDFTGRVDGIGKQPIERHVLTFDELDVLSRSKCDNLMVKAAFLFSCFTGLRISDVELLKWENIIIENGQHFLKFQQKKTGSFEKMPLGEQAVKTIDDVQKLHAEYAPEGDDRVFILPCRTRTGTILNEWGCRSGLTWRLHFHSSRHTFASMSISAGVPLFTASKLLGHKNSRTIEIYAHPYMEDNIKAVQSLPMMAVIKPESVALPPHIIASIPEQISQPQRAVTPQPGSVAEALQAKGEKIASALSLIRNASGKYEFNGREYTAAELALEV
jgi:integrase